LSANAPVRFLRTCVAAASPRRRRRLPAAAVTPAAGTPEPAGSSAATQAAEPAAQTATGNMTGCLIAARAIIIGLAGALVYVTTSRKKPDAGM